MAKSNAFTKQDLAPTRCIASWWQLASNASWSWPERTTSGPTGAREREHETSEGSAGAGRRNHKRPVCNPGWRSVSVVSAKAGNQIDGTRWRKGRRLGRELLTGNMGGDSEPCKPVHETAADSGTGKEEARRGSVLVAPRHRSGMDA